MRNCIRGAVAGVAVGLVIAAALAAVVWLTSAGLRRDYSDWYRHFWGEVCLNLAIGCGAIGGLAGSAHTFRGRSISLGRTLCYILGAATIAALLGLPFQPLKGPTSPWFAVAGALVGVVIVLITSRTAGAPPDQ